ncbi:hypothetical protein [Polycladidibacter stylochi]|uniref:hypothetical protein n=1 Tax=Polycladidibacter stylochi TaxID=1807766 RepID=UPI00082B9CC9|nr:hypothetical protein [Pseudovibrio stylochi]
MNQSSLNQEKQRINIMELAAFAPPKESLLKKLGQRIWSRSPINSRDKLVLIMQQRAAFVLYCLAIDRLEEAKQSEPEHQYFIAGKQSTMGTLYTMSYAVIADLVLHLMRKSVLADPQYIAGSITRVSKRSIEAAQKDAVIYPLQRSLYKEWQSMFLSERLRASAMAPLNKSYFPSQNLMDQLCQLLLNNEPNRSSKQVLLQKRLRVILSVIERELDRKMNYKSLLE